MKKEQNNNCVYLHINSVKQEVFYVGIGNSKRPYTKYGRTQWWHNIVKKHDYNVVILHENLSWEEACALEIKYIAQIGRNDLGFGTLINMTNGGDGTPGRKGLPLSSEHKNKIVATRTINNSYKHTEETKKRIANSNKGKTHSLETKERLSALKQGVTFTKEHKEKLRVRKLNNKNRLGKPCSEETKKYMSLNNPMRDKKHSKEAKQKMSEVHKGVTFTEEHKKKLSEAKKGKSTNMKGKPWSKAKRLAYELKKQNKV